MNKAQNAINLACIALGVLWVFVGDHAVAASYLSASFVITALTWGGGRG